MSTLFFLLKCNGYWENRMGKNMTCRRILVSISNKREAIFSAPYSLLQVNNHTRYKMYDYKKCLLEIITSSNIYTVIQSILSSSSSTKDVCLTKQASYLTTTSLRRDQQIEIPVSHWQLKEMISNPQSYLILPWNLPLIDMVRTITYVFKDRWIKIMHDRLSIHRTSMEFVHLQRLPICMDPLHLFSILQFKRQPNSANSRCIISLRAC